MIFLSLCQIILILKLNTEHLSEFQTNYSLVALEPLIGKIIIQLLATDCVRASYW